MQAIRRKQLFLMLLVLLLSGLRAEAATTSTFTVKAGGGGDFTTIQACINAMSASGGYTCVVYAGTYNEVPTLKAGGSPSSLNTLTVNPGDTVTVKGWVTASHTKISHFTITDPTLSQPCVDVPQNTTDYYITFNTMIYCGQPAGGGISDHNSSGGWSSFAYIQNNTVSWMGANTTAGSSNPVPSAQGAEFVYVIGDHHLIENNDISHVIDGVTIYGSYNVMRNNKMHDTSNADWTNKAQEDHIDMLESFCGSSVAPNSFHTLLEGNSDLRNYNSVATNAHLFGVSQYCYQAGTGHEIDRFNVAAHSATLNGGGYGSLVGVPGSSTSGYLNYKKYNDTEAALGAPNDVADFFGLGSNNSSVINVIYYFIQTIGSMAPYGQDGGLVGFTAKNNLGFCKLTCTLSSLVGSLGNITGQDPKFNNYASDDYHLQSGSPAINAGSYLTTASGSGSNSTSLTVNDPWYFQDGWGFPSANVQADWIRIGPSTTVQISSINYGTGVIMLAGAVSWNSGDPIYLYKNSTGTQVLFGTKPDIGALPFTSSAPPQPPTQLQSVVN